MKALALTLALAVMTLAAIPADAGVEYMLERVNFNPYGKTVIAGPFRTLNECQQVLSSIGYSPGGMNECDAIYTYP
jgi:hypothetical protein